ncbi:MAG TPA: SIS domain-containing protein [Thermoleophilaceae bacterium]
MHGAAMAADMAAQPAVLAELVSRRTEIVTALAGPRPAGIVVVARGSSDYAAVFGRYLFEAVTGMPVALAAPSLQTLYGVEPRLENGLAIAISQSGRTPEIATVLARFAAAGARTIAITNDSSSPLAEGASVHLALGAGPEAAVPATKTFTVELAAMALIAESLAQSDRSPFVAGDWQRLPAVVAAVLNDPEPAEQAAVELGGARELVCIARGYLVCVALEAALKLRETAGVHAEGWSAADFRHGPVIVARSDLPLLAISAAGPAAADVAELAERVRQSGAPVLRLADEMAAELPFPAGLPELLAAIPASVRAQQLTFAGRAVTRSRPGRAAGFEQGHPYDVDCPGGLRQRPRDARVTLRHSTRKSGTSCTVSARDVGPGAWL